MTVSLWTLILIFVAIMAWMKFAHASELGHEGAAFGWFSVCVGLVGFLVYVGVRG